MLQRKPNLPYTESLTADTSQLVFPCRGCAYMLRLETWKAYLSSIQDKFNKSIDNCYLEFKEEPTNKADPEAIQVWVRGEHYGMVGYVGREWASTIREVLHFATKYRIDVKNKNHVGKNTIELVLTWVVD